MKFYQLHTAEERQSAFATLSPSVWLESDLLRTWIIADPTLILKLLRSPLAVITSRAGVLRTISDKYGTELPNVAYACRVLPVLAEDDAHTAVRRGFASLLAARLNELEPQLAGLAHSALAPFARKGQLDVVSDIVDPFIGRIFSVLLRRDLPAEILSLNIGDVVFFNMTVSRLRTLDSRVAAALAFLRESGDSEDEVAWKFTCLVFGLGSLSAMLTESLMTAVNSPEDARLPDFPVETGVPVTIRLAASDFEMDGHQFRKGDLLRLQLQSLGYSDMPENHKFIFGAGMHSCVGKQLSLRIWAHFKRAFDALDIKARIIRHEFMPSHFLILYKSVQIEVL